MGAANSHTQNREFHSLFLCYTFLYLSEMTKCSFVVSCPDGEDFHDRCKAAFPNLSKTIIDLLKSELLKVEEQTKTKSLRDKWLILVPMLTLRNKIGNGDPFNFKNEQVMEMLKQAEITITEKEAGFLINKLQNEWLDKHGDG